MTCWNVCSYIAIQHIYFITDGQMEIGVISLSPVYVTNRCALTRRIQNIKYQMAHNNGEKYMLYTDQDTGQFLKNKSQSFQ